MVNFIILAGGYATFIATYLFNTDDNSLTYLDQYPTRGNPSWITSHPTDKSILYATNENSPDGTIQSFTVGSLGAVTQVDAISTGGAIPAFCACLSTGRIAVANYDNGTASFIPTDQDHLHFLNDLDLVTLPVPPNVVSGPHMIYEYGHELFVADKGTDKIWRLAEVDENPGRYGIVGDIQHAIGSGPRHLRIKDNRLYTLHQFTNTLTLEKIPSVLDNTSHLLSNVSIIPPDPPAGSQFNAAEVLVPPLSPKYPKLYIYASNRNEGVQDPRGDTIAIFENVDDQLVLRNQVYTGLDQIRTMMSGEQAGHGGEAYIVAAGVSGTAGVKVFKRTEGGANLEEVAVNDVIPTRASFVWLNEYQVLR